MNLRDYFVSQQKVSLEPTHKMELYEKITHQMHAPVSIFARMSFYTKLSLYTFVGLVFLASLYIPYFSSLFEQTDGILTTSLGGATVQADYIAQIIETKGDIAIYNNGEKVESKLFKAGDKLVLPAGAEIVFHVTTIAEAKVTGPAEFFIDKNDDGYSIQLLKGQYAEIQSLTWSATGTNNQGLGFQSNRVTIRPKQAANVHFTYTEQGKSAIIDNQGDTELVVAQADDKDQQEVLGMHSIASVAQAESGSLILEVSTGSMASGHIMTPTQVARALSQGQKHIEEEKKMIGGQQHENIKAILSAEFLAHDIQIITEQYLKGDTREYMVAYNNLYNKIHQIYIIMDLTMPQELTDARVTGSLKVLIGAIENLLHEMDTNYYVAQSHPVRLKKVLGWLYALGDKKFASLSGSKLEGNDLLGTLDLTDYKDLTN